ANESVYQTFGEGLAAFYEGDFAKAIERFASIADEDPPAKRYREKCRLLAENTPTDWDGIWRLTAK
ncbi:MAG: hypothetical protein HN348_01720, partial [Proteobacteria bacterium]|nr:hypothetical protein [Pseudomonadota bacterium]